MRRLIPYAGYEPQRSGVVKRHIDPARALALRTEGRSWSEVTDVISEDFDEPFQTDSVIMAVKRYKRENRT